MQDAAVGFVFVATILALYLRPFGAHDWQIAAGGGAVAWLVGPLGFDGGLETLRDSANIIAFFFRLMLLAAGAEASGLYARVAWLFSSRRHGRPAVLLVLVAGALCTAVLSNDATPLIFTPAILVAGAAATPPTRSTAFAATFVADGASLLLPVSNPVNLLFYERLDIGFAEYLRVITPAALAGLAALGVVAWLRSAPDESARPQPEPLQEPAPILAMAIVGLLAAGYVAAGIAEFPLSLVTLAGGVALLGTARLEHPLELRRVRRHIAPGVLLFVAGLLLLVESTERAGLLGWLSDAFEALDGRPVLLAVLGAAFLAAILSNLLNNWPAALLLATALAGIADGAGPLAAGALIGCTIGANFTVLGSLSTVFWLGLARTAGTNFGAGEYARAAALPTLAGMAAAVLVASLLA